VHLAGLEAVVAADNQELLVLDEFVQHRIGHQRLHSQPGMRAHHVVDQVARLLPGGIVGRAQRLDH
jgi:hypothetical protein